MLNQQTLHKLYVMRLNGLADAFCGTSGFESRLAREAHGEPVRMIRCSWGSPSC